jgi:hypothetical protein
MGELLMAAPALSRGVMHVHGLHNLFAIVTPNPSRSNAVRAITARLETEKEYLS